MNHKSLTEVKDMCIKRYKGSASWEASPPGGAEAAKA